MSWSWYDVGLASVARAHAAEQLPKTIENCKHILSEKKSIEAFHGALHAVCEEAEGQCVRASGSGSAWLEDGKLRSFNYKVEIEVFDLVKRG